MEPSANQIERLTRVLDLASAMIEQAEAGEWQRVAELEAGRRPLLLAPLSPPETTGEAETVAGLLRAILVADERLESLATRVRDEVAERLVRMRQGRAVSAAYNGACAV